MSNKYEHYRRHIKSGDLLIWERITTGRWAKIYGWLIQTFTRSQYVHVAIALVEDDRVMFVEAAPPEVQISCLSKFVPVYHVPMGIDWTEEHTRLLKSRLGERYSIWEAITSYFGSPKRDRHWQCAEFAHWFYEQVGLNFDYGYTPKSLVNEAVERLGTGIHRVIK